MLALGALTVAVYSAVARAETVTPPAGKTYTIRVYGVASDGTPAPLPTPEPDAEVVAAEVDARAVAIDAFLEGSPLAGQGAEFVAAGDRYGLDPRLMVAVSVFETGRCTAYHPPFNCWGYGPGLRFGSYAEAIDRVTRTFAGYGVGVETGLCYWVSGPRGACDYAYVARVTGLLARIY